jgi:hypothetical protein
MKEHDHVGAAKCAQQYLGFDPETLKEMLNDSLLTLDGDDASTASTTSVADAAKLMQQTIEELTAICVREFDSAVAAQDGERLQRYWQLFPQIGKHSVGLDKLCHYLSHNVIRTALPKDDPSGKMFLNQSLIPRRTGGGDAPD